MINFASPQGEKLTYHCPDWCAEGDRALLELHPEWCESEHNPAKGNDFVTHHERVLLRTEDCEVAAEISDRNQGAGVERLVFARVNETNDCLTPDQALAFALAIIKAVDLLDTTELTTHVEEVRA